MKKFAWLLFLLLPALCFAGTNPVLQNSATTNQIPIAAYATTAGTATNAVTATNVINAPMLTNGYYATAYGNNQGVFFGTSLSNALAASTTAAAILVHGNLYTPNLPAAAIYSPSASLMTISGDVPWVMDVTGFEPGPIINGSLNLSAMTDGQVNGVAVNNTVPSGNASFYLSVASVPATHCGIHIARSIGYSNGHNFLVTDADNVLEDDYAVGIPAGGGGAYGFVVKGASNTIVRRFDACNENCSLWIKADTTVDTLHSNVTATTFDSGWVHGSNFVQNSANSCIPMFIMAIGTNAAVTGVLIQNVVFDNYSTNGTIWLNTYSNCSIANLIVQNCTFNSPYVFDLSGLATNSILTNVVVLNCTFKTNAVGLYNSTLYPTNLYTNIISAFTYTGLQLGNGGTTLYSGNGSGLTNIPGWFSSAYPYQRTALGYPIVGADELPVVINAAGIPSTYGDEIISGTGHTYLFDPIPFINSGFTNLTVDMYLVATSKAPVIQPTCYLNVLTNGIGTPAGYFNLSSNGIFNFSSVNGTNMFHVAFNFQVPSYILSNSFDGNIIVSNANGTTNFFLLSASATTNHP